MSDKKKLQSGRRLVVKIGSAMLVDQESGDVHHRWLEALADDIADFRERGQEVIIVSSGAIAVGRRHLDLPSGPLKLDENQAAAATAPEKTAPAPRARPSPPRSPSAPRSLPKTVKPCWPTSPKSANRWWL